MSRAVNLRFWIFQHKLPALFLFAVAERGDQGIKGSQILSRRSEEVDKIGNQSAVSRNRGQLGVIHVVFDP